MPKKWGRIENKDDTDDGEKTKIVKKGKQNQWMDRKIATAAMTQTIESILLKPD